ncbi:hypothetical protein [Haloquadratum walsbyi]|uniref:DUF1102 domain-containing protein n=1 Tax=Haloquadratum walsbyi J07HQW2 TaxID=1238425 RepID=U1MU49_9EURY|nr:hypothetical protein [Haloquadratum walsbyi]ERG93829.1 MAG: hypothetical protein J07HQW2_00263 [Haloquadratum walsbyi J07HQW2]
MVDFTRRSIILGTAGVVAAGAGVTAAAGGLQGSVEGQADVQAEQALTVTEVEISGDTDASFTRTSDDNTEFQAAVELNNGDKVVFHPDVENSAADKLSVQVSVNAPDPIDITVANPDAQDGVNGGTFEIDPNDRVKKQSVQTGEGTFIDKIKPGNTEEIAIYAELDDTAEPGSYDIGVAINPLSTDN